jgi:hypothetical protein
MVIRIMSQITAIITAKLGVRPVHDNGDNDDGDDDDEYYNDNDIDMMNLMSHKKGRR